MHRIWQVEWPVAVQVDFSIFRLRLSFEKVATFENPLADKSFLKNFGALLSFLEHTKRVFVALVLFWC